VGKALKIYTKTGDDGTTGLLGRGRVEKDNPRIDAYGTIDELNAALGVARATALPGDLDELVGRIQNDLFVVGSALADPDPNGRYFTALGDERIEAIEKAIDRFEAELLPLNQFILPGGSPPAAQFHLARTICRRAERAIVHLGRQPDEPVSTSVVVYVNRLSDLLFVLARTANFRAGVADVAWEGLGGSGG
jgi:cob(I)alamin adenosyltransferase